MASMDMEQYTDDHDAQSRRVRDFLALELKGLIDTLKAQIQFDPSAGMITALIAAYRELGRNYQTHERPGGGRLTELQVSRLIEAERLAERARVLDEVNASQRGMLQQAGTSVRESLIALSDKSLG